MSHIPRHVRVRLLKEEHISRQNIVVSSTPSGFHPRKFTIALLISLQRVRYAGQ